MATVEVDERDCLNPKDLEELYTWIDTVPLSRAKKNINRDFSDGVSVAEIVHFSMPRLIELHNYVNANSSAQKRINWNMLNRKVFGKLNIRLGDRVIDNIIDSKPGAIEQVLWDLRKKVIELNPKTFSKNLSRSNTATLLRGKSPSVGYSEAKLSKGPHSSVSNSSHVSRIPTKASQGLVSPLTKKATAVSLSHNNPSKATKASEGSSYIDGFKNELSQYGNNVNTPTNSSAPSASSETNGAPSGSPDLNANLGDQASLPPAHLIYKGHKMVPSLLLDIKNRQVRDLEAVVNSLQKKVNFLDNLIQLKDNRIEDMTRQLHALRTKFQDLTQTRIHDIDV